MFDTNYYCLVAGLREYSLDGGAKGFDPHAILDEILRELTPRDLRAVRLLYGYYDCKNLIALRAGSPAHDPLGNFARERLKEETEHPRLLPHAIGLCWRPMPAPTGRRPRRWIPRAPSNRRFSKPITDCAPRRRAVSCASGAISTARCATSRRATTARAAGRPVDGTSWVTTTWPSSCAVRRPPTSACGANCPTSMR